MNRVAVEHIEHRDDDRTYWNGSPFTGIAYATEGDQISYEIGYREGRKWGPSRSWYDDGQPSSEEHYAWDWAHGVFRQWNATGGLASEETYEWGVCLERKEWDDTGTLVATESLVDTDPEFEVLAKRRSKFGQLAFVTDAATEPPAAKEKR